MPFDSDVALLGTGLAPLIAANHFLIQGKSVLLLNPDRDFFLEDSEISLDPLLHTPPTLEQLHRSSPEKVLAALRPDFPGPIEFWSKTSEKLGFHDPLAPHVRQRDRLWISSLEQDRHWNWERLEDLYVEASDGGLNPQILQDLTAARRFPGFSANTGNFQGLLIPKLCDVDSIRYRNGLLELIRERLSSDRAVCAVNQIEWMPEGIRFHAKGSLNTARLKMGMLVFWTPRLSPWILKQAKSAERIPHYPRGVRLWEQWYLNTRTPPDTGVVGMFGNMAVWADFEGPPSLNSTSVPEVGNPANRLSVLMSGPLMPLEDMNVPQAGLSWASGDSFRALSNLCHGFLKWDRFSIRGMKARAVFEWKKEESWLLSQTDPLVRVITACDGPLVDVVRVTRSACDELLRQN